MSSIAKKGSGNFTLSKEIGGEPNSTSSVKPGAGGSDGGNMARKGSGNITVDRSVTSPPTRKPAK